MNPPKTFAEHPSARAMEKELRRRLKTIGILRFFGFRLVSAAPGRVMISYRVRPHHLQVHRVVHGGVAATLADTAGGLATIMSLPLGTRIATVEMKINFLEPIERGTVTADARVIRCGRNFSVVDCDVRDSEGRMAAKALMTFAIGVGAVPEKR
ncbi:MAG TPA: PaaI family thioesterase [Candidatus Acidoferrales bacterium]|nr:PaaI family thioesterase [Candidatus Acidoferrales bacterium]